MLVQVCKMSTDGQHGADVLMVAVRHILDPLSHGVICYVETVLL